VFGSAAFRGWEKRIEHKTGNVLNVDGGAPAAFSR
jgi:hypothetical protein